MAAVAIAMTGVAAPAAADDGLAGSTETSTSWSMPDVKGSVLQAAVSSIESAAEPAELRFAYDDTKGNRDVINLTNWTVCWQWPKADATVSPKVSKISLGVKRLNDKNCYRPN